MVTIIISWFIDYSYVYNIYIYTLLLHWNCTSKNPSSRKKNNAGSVLHIIIIIIIIIHTRALTA